MEEVKDNKKLSLIEKIILSVFIFIGGFITFFSSFALNLFFTGAGHSHGKKEFSIIEKIRLGSMVSIWPSIPVSFFILLLLNINIDYQINLINYLKCLLFIFIIIFLYFFIKIRVF